MALLGTSVAQPNWQADKLRSAGEALRLAVAASQERQEQRRQRDIEEMNSFFRAAAETPELATTWGTDIERRYGKKYPGVQPLIQALRKRNEVQAGIDRAGSRYLDTLGMLETDYGQQQERVAGMPDAIPIQIPVGLGGPGPTIPIPNVEKAVEAGRLANVNPALFPFMARQRLTPRERALAQLGGKGGGYAMPAGFDPFEDLPPEGKAILASQLQLLSGPVAEWALTEGGLQPTRAALQEQGFKREERLGGEAATEKGRKHATAEREAKAAESEARLRLQDSLIRGRQANSAALQMDVMSYQRSLNPKEGPAGEKVSVKMLAQDNANAVQDWDRRLHLELQGVSRSNVRTEKRQAFEKANGKRPRLIPQAHLLAITKKVNAEKDLPPEERQALVDGVLADYLAKVEVGKQPAKALQEVLSEP